MRMHLLSFLILPLLSLASVDEQTIIPVQLSDEEAYMPMTNAQPTLADLLTIESSASIFYSYARELELSALFAGENSRMTLLVPTNKAVMALARKPHEGPAPIKDGVILPEEQFDAMSKENVKRWVSAHIIPRSPISLLSSDSYDTLLAGKSVSFEEVSDDENAEDWQRVRLNDGVRLLGIKEAQNGVVYMIDGTVTLD